MGGTLTIAVSGGCFGVQYSAFSVCGVRGWKGSGWLLGAVGALLGPEGTGWLLFDWLFLRLGRLGSYRHAFVVVGGLLLLVVGLLFEICIVDASIFYSWFLCVSFLGRMVDALVPGADEGRGRLR